MPYSIRELFYIWKDQFDWEPFQKVRDAAILGLGLGSYIDLIILFVIKL